MNNEKRSRCYNSIFVIIITVLTLIMLDMVLFADYNEFNTLSSAENENAILYSQLKEYEKELQENIENYKEERAAKAKYLADLDKRYAELETQYKELLRQKKLISDKLADMNIE